ncbi:MAG: glycosyltransferase family 39 protein, partial [Saprospiraceae bacterium]|nr:glycosyltransferase family 39 protein [Saprospiraceae bacterium]
MAKNAAGNKPRPTQTVKPAVVAPPPDWTALANQYAMPVLWGLLALGLILRVVQLDALSLWIDEFVHVLRAKGVAEGTGPLLTDDNNGILLTILQVPLFKIFGAGSWIARIPSVLFGVGTIWLLYRIGWQLFGRHVGLLAAGGATISLYLIFWSRISRNYAIFAFFFLLFSWLFLKVFESRKNDNSHKNYLDYVWVALALLASLLSHQLTVFFAFMVGVYSIVIAAGKIINATEDRFKNKYFIVACLAIPVLAIMLIPGLNNLLRAPLSTLLSAQQIDWVLPNTQHLSELWAKRPWESFGIYNGVLRYEMTLLYPLGLLGFVVAFTMNKRSAIWLACA